MNRTTAAAALATFALLTSAHIHAAPAFADEENASKPAETSPSDTPKDTSDDKALKALEGGFSIPAADGATGDKKTKK